MQKFIQRDNCAFCGNKIDEYTKVNGEHIFPAFACKQIFGKSEGSSALQQKIKLSVCQECNSKYGPELETKLKSIIKAIETGDKNFIFRTEEALTLLDYATKTRVLLSFRKDKSFDPTQGYFARLQKISPMDRQLIITRGPVPDGIYIPRRYRTQVPAKGAAFISTENSPIITCCAIVINGVILISFENVLAAQGLGFPMPRVYWANKDGRFAPTMDEKGDIIETVYPGLNTETNLWFDLPLPEVKQLLDSCVVLAQPRNGPDNIENEYMRNRRLSKQHGGYKYGVYYKTANKTGWLTKDKSQRGARGVDVANLTNVLTLPDFEMFMRFFAEAEHMTWDAAYFSAESGHEYDGEYLMQNFAENAEIKNILSFGIDELDLYRQAEKLLRASGRTDDQVIAGMYKFIKNLNAYKAQKTSKEITAQELVFGTEIQK